MSVRDLGFWTRAAHRNQIDRQIGLCNAALMTLMKDDDIRAEMERLNMARREQDLDVIDQAQESERRFIERVKAGTHRPRGRTKKKKKIKQEI